MISIILSFLSFYPCYNKNETFSRNQPIQQKWYHFLFHFCANTRLHVRYERTVKTLWNIMCTQFNKECTKIFDSCKVLRKFSNRNEIKKIYQKTVYICLLRMAAITANVNTKITRKYHRNPLFLRELHLRLFLCYFPRIYISPSAIVCIISRVFMKCCTNKI